MERIVESSKFDGFCMERLALQDFDKSYTTTRIEIARMILSATKRENTA